ncbi:phosphotransferase family protein [Amycolatopsis thermophila]|uniref:Aminoglycoside phosphotransferase (APT) family kinase protein n=1 Tax=Amycolatopsis thermophila TaxID=206084 RepID=A0ABU0F035_9PSEU|nr:phosphotransferase family protein [Amycolatopsis thermophila]MDQ0380556.1 aminoglycoside phosphotransferase (APT) family kinase protein [Amycolatopsis thermophila]
MLSASELDALAAWMDARGLPGGPVEDLAPIAGGTQNRMFSFRRGGRAYVLRSGPRHRRAGSNDALRREMRVLDALSGTAVPHPALIAACPEETVWPGAVFYLMEPVDGFNATVELPEPHASRPGLRHAMGLAMADALAALGAVDHEAVGLGDFGRPHGFLDRQVPRWLAELDSYRGSYPGPELPGVEAVAEWLGACVPRRWSPGILHGDFHLANVMFSRADATVAAIVDWEMSTIGDPLLDLGWLLATWPGTRGALGWQGLATAAGLAGEDEIIARYAARSERDLSAIDWYVVLACFKLGIILEGTHARAWAGKAPHETGRRLHTAAVGLFEQALDRIAAA